MSQKENAAERIRPFLKEMERSIRKARNERIADGDQSEPQDTPPRPGQRPIVSHPTSQDALIGHSRNEREVRTEQDRSLEVNGEQSSNPGRLKARPKRPTAFESYRPQSNSRSEAV